MRMHERTPWTAAAVAALALGVASGARAQTHAEHAAPSASPAKLALLDDRVKAGIAEALADEWHGEAIYARVLKDHGDVRPFSNIVRAERRHAAFLEDLLKGRGLAVPENRWADADVPGSASLKEACATAVEFETKNVALYDRLAAGPLPDDVKSVFHHNRMASLEHHKPAFERCSGAGPAQVARPRGPGCCGHGNGRRQGGGRCGHGGWGRAGGPPANEAKPAGPGR